MINVVRYFFTTALFDCLRCDVGYCVVCGYSDSTYNYFYPDMNIESNTQKRMQGKKKILMCY